MNTDTTHAPSKILMILMLSTNFASGASIMIVEIAGARLMAPIVGNSLYTWTALIGVVLVALAIGGWMGGHLADRRDGRGSLALLLAFSAATVLLIPTVSLLSIARVSSMGLISGPMLLSLILFSVPALLQGAVSPLATRIISRDHQDKKVGLSAGLVNASGALGSFVGTLAAGFYLVPNFELQTIFGGVAVALSGIGIACGVAYLRNQQRVPLLAKATVGAALLVSLVMYYGVDYRYPDSVRLVRQTPYHQIRVVDFEDAEGRSVRELVHDTAVQGYQYLDSNELPRKYQRSWRLSDIYLPMGIESALFVGGGSFSIPKALKSQHPEASVTVVEIDPAVVETGYEWFALGDGPKIDVVSEDARRYLVSDNRTYDYIYLDAYNGIRQVPAHLVTKEFFALVQEHLNEQGVLMINLIGHVEQPYSGVFDAVYTTLSEIFDTVEVYVSSEGEQLLEEVMNLTIVAGNASLQQIELSGHESDDQLSDLLSGLVSQDTYDGRVAPVLTDSLNPIDALVAKSLKYSVKQSN